MTVEHRTHVVVGAGALGTAAAYWLSRRGAHDVLVLEQFELGHGRGASEDHSRIIRHAYHAPEYAALTRAAYAAWAEVEAETGLPLVTVTGGLDLAADGTAGETTLANYRAAMRAEGHEFEELTAAEIRRRFPQWRIDDDVRGLFQAEGGILDIRKAGAGHVALARARGVEFRASTTVTGLASTADGVRLETDRGPVRAENVVLAVASWLPHLREDLGLPWEMTLSQEQVGYFAGPHLARFAPDRFPMFVFHGGGGPGEDRVHYGFPVFGEPAVKVARDMSGRFIRSEERSYDPDPAETALLRRFLERHLPDAVGPELLSKTCVYDMTPDRDFVIDRVPGHPRVLALLGAGHAGKFAGLIGQIAADLSLEGRTEHPIGAFAFDRPALTDPGFVPTFRLNGEH
ncbi:N-methyl-L-tryptophan oxidase [Kineococcus gynurae]|uniref:N-methyl-L-tryptophan oxidase n=1 Tax=Kineococcus gynurae TaxID=452979 RepID=A0ABV5LQB5_9ACTN